MISDDGRQPADWTELRARLLVRICQACARRWYFTRNRCPRCGSADIDASASTGRGTAVATTTIHRAPAGTAVDRVPFSIVLVDLDEGIRVMGRCARGTRPGDRVTVQFEDGSAAGQLVPFFHPSGGTT